MNPTLPKVGQLACDVCGLFTFLVTPSTVCLLVISQYLPGHHSINLSGLGWTLIPRVRETIVRPQEPRSIVIIFYRTYCHN